MNLPPIDPAILAQFNIKPEDRLPKVDFGLNIPTKQKQKPLKNILTLNFYNFYLMIIIN